MLARMALSETQLAQTKRELALLSPYQVLERGYAIVMRGGAPVESAGMLAAGETVTLRLKDGSAQAKIMSTKKEEAT